MAVGLMLMASKGHCTNLLTLTPGTQRNFWYSSRLNICGDPCRMSGCSITKGYPFEAMARASHATRIAIKESPATCFFCSGVRSFRPYMPGPLASRSGGGPACIPLAAEKVVHTGSAWSPW